MATRKVMFFGDSLIAGYEVDVSDRFTTLIGEEFASTKRNWEVVNCGRSGDDLKSGLARFDTELDTHRPNVVCICLGGNDFFAGRWTTPNVIKIELFTLLNKALSRGITPVLMGFAPPIPQLTLVLGEKARFFTVYEELAKELTIPILKTIFTNFPLRETISPPAGGGLDPRAIFNPTYFVDIVHPNAKGHAVVAKTVVEFLTPILTKLESHSK